MDPDQSNLYGSAKHCLVIFCFSLLTVSNNCSGPKQDMGLNSKKFLHDKMKLLKKNLKFCSLFFCFLSFDTDMDIAPITDPDPQNKMANNQLHFLLEYVIGVNTSSSSYVFLH